MEMEFERTGYQRFLDITTVRAGATLSHKIVLTALLAALTGVLAQVRLTLPFTPVPVTGQTLGVLLAGAALGKKWGAASMGLYGLLGLAGLPWFNGAAAGLGATTGYIIGFVPAAAFVGYATRNFAKARTFAGLFTLMLFACLALVYVPGLAWLGGWLKLVLHKQVGVGTLVGMGALPFIAGDVLKVALAAGIALVLLPKAD
jgi:biotin transport system substrate-specific component